MKLNLSGFINTERTMKRIKKENRTEKSPAMTVSAESVMKDESQHKRIFYILSPARHSELQVSISFA